MGAFGSAPAIGFALSPLIGLQVRNSFGDDATWTMFAVHRRHRGGARRAGAGGCAPPRRWWPLCCTGIVRQDEREALLREDVPRAQTARERRQLAGVDEDLRSSPLRGSRFRCGSATSVRGRRLPRLPRRAAPLHGQAARDREPDRGPRAGPRGRARTARAGVSCGRLRGRMAEVAEAWSFHEVNDLIERHNRWFPASHGCPWIPAAATSRSSTGATTGCVRSTRAGCSSGSRPEPPTELTPLAAGLRRASPRRA